MTPAKVHRIEITLSDDKLASLDAARQHEPRASFIKRAIDAQVRAALSSSEAPEPAREEGPRRSDGTIIPRNARPAYFARQQALNDAKAKKR